ncbi:hypothetical protein PLICRDRAFT_29844 [Plicaturopsis crispa FD-325 SS-3]|nr:hypothetical protein PLICRDRAFT_29844 [Plicaturopsis crispa FD-325 SS-3]
MPHLSDEQLAALLRATQILGNAGLSAADLATSLEDHSPQSHEENLDSTLAEPAASKAYIASLYDPPAARAFKEDSDANRVNRRTHVDALIDHPIGVVVEYPQTGSSSNETVAHRFAIDPLRVYHPKFNLQYSLGDKHGGRKNVLCQLLLDKSGNAALCDNLKTTCKGLKICSASPHHGDGHHFTSRSAIASGLAKPRDVTVREEVFLKTLAFFSVLIVKGCSFEPDPQHGADTSESSGSDSDSGSPSMARVPPRKRECSGTLVLKYNQYKKAYIQCEHRSKSRRSHLILRNLDEYNIEYLRALLHNDSDRQRLLEEAAEDEGYGPLVPCSYTASPSEQKEMCPYWHRSPDGKLRQGTLRRWQHKCSADFDIYTPVDLFACPQILIICRNAHSHPPPRPIKTPPVLLDIFRDLLLSLDWKLADATPRKIVLDSAFMCGLRNHLGWRKTYDPSLSHLHPSLGNFDHVRRHINTLRDEYFPHGTGFDGAKYLVDQHRLLPAEEQYVRCAETHIIDRGKPFNLIICMTRAMSRHLMVAKHVSIDTSFRRVHGWEEFEMESWNLECMRSIVGVRAFTTSQTAEAHSILLRRIFDFASSDTGIPVAFQYIHGTGFESWIADAHKGQGLGVGLFCQSLCVEAELECRTCPKKHALRDLDPYGHLAHFYRTCTLHFKTKIHDLRFQVSKESRAAMLSLSSSEPHPDLEGAYATIRKGGRKATAWLKDKLEGTKFALAGLYQPASLIPLSTWKAGPSTTNGNEQGHRNGYRDGKDLTVLAGIIRGMHFDARQLATVEVQREFDIYSRDQPATRVRRITRAFNRQVLSQRAIIAAALDDSADATDTPHSNTTPIEAEIPREGQMHHSDVTLFTGSANTYDPSQNQHEDLALAFDPTYPSLLPVSTAPMPPWPLSATGDTGYYVQNIPPPSASIVEPSSYPPLYNMPEIHHGQSSESFGGYNFTEVQYYAHYPGTYSQPPYYTVSDPTDAFLPDNDNTYYNNYSASYNNTYS